MLRESRVLDVERCDEGSEEDDHEDEEDGVLSRYTKSSQSVSDEPQQWFR